MSWHQLKAKYANNCYECKKYFNQGTLIFWDDYTHKVKHVECLEIKPKSSKILPQTKCKDSIGNIPTPDHNDWSFVSSINEIDYPLKDSSPSEFERRKQAREFQRDLNGQ